MVACTPHNYLHPIMLRPALPQASRLGDVTLCGGFLTSAVNPIADQTGSVCEISVVVGVWMVICVIALMVILYICILMKTSLLERFVLVDQASEENAWLFNSILENKWSLLSTVSVEQLFDRAVVLYFIHEETVFKFSGWSLSCFST